LQKGESIYKKRLKAMLVAIAVLILLCSAAVVIASKITTHTHQVLSRDTVAVEKLHTHSHYCQKNGRLDWWPVIVTENYEILHFRCRDCKKPIPEFDTWRLTSTSWKFAY
jgi:hypothetical protein